MYDWNEAVRSLNVGLPDDIARLKAAGYYQEAIARIDRLLAEDWTKTQNGPASNGIAPPEGYVPPENPTPHGVDALREALTVQKEIMRRLPGEYCWTEAEAIARMQERVKDFKQRGHQCGPGVPGRCSESPCHCKRKWGGACHPAIPQPQLRREGNLRWNVFGTKIPGQGVFAKMLMDEGIRVLDAGELPKIILKNEDGKCQSN